MKKSDRVTERSVGLYVHLPFCLRKCSYCDFCSYPGQDADTVHRYVTRLCDELLARAPSVSGRAVDTLYFGGGTPTLLPTEEFERLLHTVRTHYALCADAEITTECNPATADRPKLSRLRELGINRLSIGAQSAVDEELHALGRVHTFAQTQQTVQDARAAGFDNLSLDLMYGIPHQTPESLARSLDAALALEPEHLSVYSLIIEPGTPFYERRDSLVLADEDALCQMSEQVLSYLRSHGYERYEISNFARDGHRCRHNMRYWNLDDYLGFGIAAHSLLCLPSPAPDGTTAIRNYNKADLTAYLGGLEVCETSEVLRADELCDEYVMLRLRLADGIDKREFSTRFARDFDAVYGAAAAPFIDRGLLINSPEHIAFSDSGFDVSNAVLAEILFH